MTVNSVDAHPNVALQLGVANLVLDELRARGYVELAVSSNLRHWKLD